MNTGILSRPNYWNDKYNENMEFFEKFITNK